MLAYRQTAPPIPVGAAGAVWDARWQVSPGWGEGLMLGALGEAGLRTIGTPLRPAGWEAMPHCVRLTLPAMRRGSEVVAIPLPPGGEAAPPATAAR